MIKPIIGQSLFLSLLSKAFGKNIYDQLKKYMESILNELFCGSRKANSTQHALFRLLQKWQANFDSGDYAGAIVMDLSKAYDCL